MSLIQTNLVTPDLIPGKAFLGGISSGRDVSEGSQTPGQARVDEGVLEIVK